MARGERGRNGQETVEAPRRGGGGGEGGGEEGAARGVAWRPGAWRGVAWSGGAGRGAKRAAVGERLCAAEPHAAAGAPTRDEGGCATGRLSVPHHVVLQGARLSSQVATGSAGPDHPAATAPNLGGRPFRPTRVKGETVILAKGLRTKETAAGRHPGGMMPTVSLRPRPALQLDIQEVAGSNHDHGGEPSNRQHPLPPVCASFVDTHTFSVCCILFFLCVHCLFARLGVDSPCHLPSPLSPSLYCLAPVRMKPRTAPTTTTTTTAATATMPQLSRRDLTAIHSPLLPGERVRGACPCCVLPWEGTAAVDHAPVSHTKGHPTQNCPSRSASALLPSTPPHPALLPTPHRAPRLGLPHETPACASPLIMSAPPLPPLPPPPLPPLPAPVPPAPPTTRR